MLTTKNQQQTATTSSTFHGQWVDLPLCVCVFFCVFVCLFFSSFLPFFLSLFSLFSLISRFLSFSLSRSFFLCFFLYLSSSLLAHPGSLDLWIYQQARCVRHETMRHCFHLRSSCTLCAKIDEPCLKAARSHAISAEPSLSSLHYRPCASSTQSLTSVFWEVASRGQSGLTFSAALAE